MLINMLKRLLTFLAYLVGFGMVSIGIYIATILWVALWMSEVGLTEYINLDLAAEASKQMPYYLFKLYVFISEFFGADPNKLKVNTFIFIGPIYIVILFSPLTYFFTLREYFEIIKEENEENGNE